jgi:2-C-methyl-D-erythritol 2,4-cyclodiphosphate synthase
VLGGIIIDHHLGLDGHSDADVLLHALIDAMFGAAGMRDIGYHFPPDDERYKGIESTLLLAETKKLLVAEGWKIINVDMTVIAEAPKLAPYIEAMREKIAETLAVPGCCVSVKATTTEGLGVCGRQEGMAAQAVVLLEKSAHPGPVGHEAV